MGWNEASRIQCRLKFACSERWEEMKPITDGVRFCAGCESPVYEVRSQQELDARAGQGQCVSVRLPEPVPHPLPFQPGDLGPRLTGQALPPTFPPVVIVPEARLTGKPRRTLPWAVIATVIAGSLVAAAYWLLA